MALVLHWAFSGRRLTENSDAGTPVMILFPHSSLREIASKTKVPAWVCDWTRLA